MEKTPSTSARRTLAPASKREMRLGDKVMVVKLIDLHIFGHDEKEEFKEFCSHKWKTGTVVGFSNTECGATPKDPMILVEFSNKKRDAFWTEELKLVT